MSFYTRLGGFLGTSQQDMVAAIASNWDAERVQGAAADALGMFEWQWDLQARRRNIHTQAEQIQHAMHVEVSQQASKVYSQLNQAMIKIMPKQLPAQHLKAAQFDAKDDLVKGIVRNKKAFGMSGFSLSYSDSNKGDKMDEWIEASKLYQFLVQSWESIVISDNLIVVMKGKKAKTNLTIIPPENAIVKRTFLPNDDGSPGFRLFVKPSIEFIQYIRLLQKSDETRGKVDDKWILAISGKKATDPLVPQGYAEMGGEADKDETVFLINTAGVRDGLIAPSMATVFTALSLRELLQDGEYSISYLIKHFIHQIKIGPDPGNNATLTQALKVGRVGTKEKTATLNEYKKKVDKVILEVTDKTLEHVFIFPGSEVDMGKKYISPEKKIMFWGQVSEQVVTGAGGTTFAAGVVYLKGYRASIKLIRSLFEGMVRMIYANVTGDKLINTLSIDWDEHFMKEPKQLLAELVHLMRYGMPTDNVLKALGYSRMAWIAEKEKYLTKEELEAKNSDETRYIYWLAIDRPIWEPMQGLLQGEGGGRPEEDGLQTDEEGVEPQPRPATE